MSSLGDIKAKSLLMHKVPLYCYSFVLIKIDDERGGERRRDGAGIALGFEV